MYCRPSLLAILALASVAIAFPVGRPETRAAAAVRRAAAINFGSCSDPEVTVNNGVFSVGNTKDFGSVQSSTFLDDVTLGICNVLATKCGVDGITNGDCSTAASDAIGVGNSAGAADEFNSVLGITSDFASTAAAAAGGAAVATTTADASSTTTSVASKATHTNVAAAASGKDGKGGKGGKTECVRSVPQAEAA
ncbi:hypothetical protein CALCODRAFT_480281 [Calocera cornea HHB12733]|uniref:Hydrophobin n=1 Tax=Calocera cornea HHB12733 TaxID=1353952 RepID=A0A165IR46_9BASI|nr:hypothetical protein CALCODRAFT_480281 [Calocera cornea HHB12733]